MSVGGTGQPADTRHHGRLDAFPPYVGGDDDEIDGWEAVCDCGWRGRKTAYSGVASVELVGHLNAALDGVAAERAEAEAEIETCRKGSTELAGLLIRERAELADLRQALTEIDHLVRHEWRLKHHDSAFVLNTIEQVLDDPALAGSVEK